jgi:hypothetical protein
MLEAKNITDEGDISDPKLVEVKPQKDSGLTSLDHSSVDEP